MRCCGNMGVFVGLLVQRTRVLLRGSSGPICMILTSPASLLVDKHDMSAWRSGKDLSRFPVGLSAPTRKLTKYIWEPNTHTHTHTHTHTQAHTYKPICLRRIWQMLLVDFGPKDPKTQGSPISTSAGLLWTGTSRVSQKRNAAARLFSWAITSLFPTFNFLLIGFRIPKETFIPLWCTNIILSRWDSLRRLTSLWDVEAHKTFWNEENNACCRATLILRRLHLLQWDTCGKQDHLAVKTHAVSQLSLVTQAVDEEIRSRAVKQNGSPISV